jgi:hypothetical protein
MGFSIPKQKSYQNLHLFHLSLEQRVHANRKQKEEQKQEHEAKEECTLCPSFILSEAYHIAPPVRCIMHNTT